MSRIDNAIERAAQNKMVISPLRENDNGSRAQAAAPVHDLSSAGYDRIKQRHLDNSLLAPLTDPNSTAAEQYRKLRTLIMRKSQMCGGENTLLVTSSVPGEGKSLTALNLAISIAQTEHSVVIIDADLRSPQLHSMLEMSPEYGLLHYLKGQASIEKIMTKAGIGNLTLIPSGGSMRDPLSLIGSNRMQLLIDELKSRYHDRFIIVDSPPLLPFADVAALGEMMDNIIYVCREGSSKLKQIEEGLEILKEYNLLGIVCNDINMLLKPDYSYYGNARTYGADNK